MTDEEYKAAAEKAIEEYTGLDIDWEDPPGSAELALNRMLDYKDIPAGTASESIDDLSKSYINNIGLDPIIKEWLHSIRKLKW